MDILRIDWNDFQRYAKENNLMHIPTSKLLKKYLTDKQKSEKEIMGIANLAIPFETGSGTIYLPLHMVLESVIEEMERVHDFKGETITYTAMCGRITFEF